MSRHELLLAASIALLGALVLTGCPVTPPTYDAVSPPSASDQLVNPDDLDAAGGSTNGMQTVSVAQLAGAGGRIVHAGRVYTDAATVAPNDLLIVDSGGKLYLYNPALGDVQLSEETNRAALAVYLLGQTPAPATAKRRSAAAEIDVRGEPVLLSTKVLVSHPSTATVVAVNQLHRFAVVRRVSDLEVHYLAPANERFDANWLRQFVDHALPGLKGIFPDVFDTTRVELSMESGRLQTFGSSFGTFGSPLPADEAHIQGDRVMIELDEVQDAYMYAECWKTLLSVLPLEAGDAVFVAIGDLYEIVHMPNAEQRIQQLTVTVENLTYSLGTGAIEGFGLVSGGWPGAAMLVFNTLSDFYAAATFMRDEVYRTNPAWRTATCYDFVDVQPAAEMFPASYYGDATMSVNGQAHPCQVRVDLWDLGSPTAFRLHLDVPALPHFMLGSVPIDRWFEGGQSARVAETSRSGTFGCTGSKGEVVRGAYTYEQAEGTIDFTARNPQTRADDTIRVTFRVRRT